MESTSAPVTPHALPESAPRPRFKSAGFDEFRRAGTDGTVDWLWEGYVARGNVTLLTSQWKSGKTTLVSVLLARMGTGGGLGGQAVRPGRAIVVSEEDPSLWVARDTYLDIGPHVELTNQPFDGRPTEADWSALVDYLCDRRRQAGIDLVVIDSLAGFLPGSENDAKAMLALIQPLQRLARLGVAVLVLHHPRKGSTLAGQAARGSGALPAAVDILIEMDWFKRQEDDRRRMLYSFSRHRVTPRRLAVEWSADGRDYAALGEAALDDFDAGWPVLQALLEDAYQKLTRKGILDAWPQDHPKPSEATLWRWLDRALTDSRVQRDGSGRSRSPFRYWLTGQEKRWASDPDRLADLPPFDNFDLV